MLKSRKAQGNSLAFSKFHGAGNDFILIADFERNFSPSLVKRLCDRHLGIGADGLILARPSQLADFEMVYFNADGSTPSMCGNGLRCFVHFLRTLGYVKSLYQIEVAGNLLTVKWQQSRIFTFLPSPRTLFWAVPFFSHVGYVVDTGVPHIVVFAPPEINVVEEGRLLRYHEMLQPEGANVNFVWKTKEGFLGIRTYERGVENETLACASGGAAAAFVAERLGLFGKEISVLTQSGEVLEIQLGKEIGITGPSEKVFDGYIACTRSQKKISQKEESSLKKSVS